MTGETAPFTAPVSFEASALCAIPWGVCPRHGRMLRSSAGRAWCKMPGCGLEWGYDRLSSPCPDPVWGVITDVHGHDRGMCEGHARDAEMYMHGATLRQL